MGPGPGYLCGPGGWAVIIELVYPLSNIALIGLAFVFPRIVENAEKTVAHVESFPTPVPRTAILVESKMM